MNKKEHVDKQANKVTVKGKTSTGVSYEMNVDPYNSCCADVAVTLPVDPKCDVKITNKSSKGVASNEVEALIKVASGGLSSYYQTIAVPLLCRSCVR